MGYVNILEVFQIKALILEPHKRNLCETNSIQKTTNLSSTLCLKIMKNHQLFLSNNCRKTTKLMITKNMKNARSCVKRCSFTQNLAKTFVEWGHKIKFPEFNINRKTIFLSKTNKTPFCC